MVKEFKTKEISGTRTVGERLRLSRKRKHLTLEQAEKDTKIRLKYLEAFEHGQHHILPSEVYAIGFLRCYAEYLGLKADELISLYKTEWQAAMTKNGQDTNNPGFAPSRQIPRWQFSITPKAFLVVIIALFVLSLFGYIWWSVSKFSAPPKLVIEKPQANDIIKGETLIVKGETDPGAYIYINHEPVSVNGKGEFSQEVTISDNLNTIVIEAKNMLDRHTYKTIKILAENDK